MEISRKGSSFLLGFAERKPGPSPGLHLPIFVKSEGDVVEAD